MRVVLSPDTPFRDLETLAQFRVPNQEDLGGRFGRSRIAKLSLADVWQRGNGSALGLPKGRESGGTWSQQVVLIVIAAVMNDSDRLNDFGPSLASLERLKRAYRFFHDKTTIHTRSLELLRTFIWSVGANR